MKILIAEDDRHTREGLAEVLRREGYTTICAADGEEALAAYRREEPDVVCLDIMMPAVDGYEVCRELRRHNQRLPIVFISAKSEEMDRVIGLEIGADDFIVKPFGVREVVARIRAVTRRCLAVHQQDGKRPCFRMRDLTVFPAELRARRAGETIDLSLRDIKILELLSERRGQVIDRNTFFDACWGVDYLPNSRTLDQHISQLRKRIEHDPQRPAIIRTVHRAGYRFDE